MAYSVRLHWFMCTKGLVLSRHQLCNKETQERVCALYTAFDQIRVLNEFLLTAFVVQCRKHLISI